MKVKGAKLKRERRQKRRQRGDATGAEERREPREEFTIVGEVKRRRTQPGMAVPPGIRSIEMIRFNPLGIGVDLEDGKATASCRTPKKLLLGGFDFCGFHFGSGVGVLLGEAFDAAGGVNQLLLSGEEGVAARTDFDVQLVALDSRASLEVVATGAVHRYDVIVGVNAGFHEAPFVRVRSARLAFLGEKDLTPKWVRATAASLGRDANPHYTGKMVVFPNSVRIRGGMLQHGTINSRGIWIADRLCFRSKMAWPWGW